MINVAKYLALGFLVFIDFYFLEVQLGMIVAFDMRGSLSLSPFLAFLSFFPLYVHNIRCLNRETTWEFWRDAWDPRRFGEGSP